MVDILKTLWTKGGDGLWGVSGIKGLELRPKSGYDSNYFAIEPTIELMTSSPRGLAFQGLLQTFGTSEFLMQQSILPVVAFVEGERSVRCIGTAFVVSCTGILITACHVLLDPHESGYSVAQRKTGGGLEFGAELSMGVLLPINPAQGHGESFFLPFEFARYWGEWRQSPLLHEPERFDMFTDIAVCKIAELEHGRVHQPLNLSLNPFRRGEQSYTIGYAEINDISVETMGDGSLIAQALTPALFVSVGETLETYPENHLRRDVPTPGPCFGFKAKIPGKMSGAPIFGADGAVVRGVVSRSFSGEHHAFGAMLGPAMTLPLRDSRTLADVMIGGRDGMSRVQGVGL